MTPYQSQLAAQSYQYRYERDVSLAWYVAALSRTKHLPTLHTLLKRRRRVMTPEEMRAEANAHNERIGRKGER